MQHDHSTKLVSIIIPVHNNWHLTKACLDSIRFNTTVPYEVLLVDDCSSDETSLAIRAYEEVRVIRNETRRSFSASNNVAAKEARGEFLCLLNNDTFVTPFWLEPLIAVTQLNPTAGVVGGKHLFPMTQLLNHCGIAFDRDGFPWHIRPHSQPNQPACNYERDVPALTFACVLIRKTTFDKLGGLDETFVNGFEDVDFCLRASEAGLRCIYTPASVIYHYGQSTPGRTRFDEQNWTYFRHKWAGKIRPSLDEIVACDNSFDEEIAAMSINEPAGAAGMHFAFDLSGGSAFNWLVADFAEELHRQGEAISLPVTRTLSNTIEPQTKAVLMSIMKRVPNRSVHIKLNHYWPQHFRQSISGELNAEMFCNNYRFRPNARLDSWMRSTLLNTNKKLALGEFNAQVLRDIGVDEQDIQVIPLGYSKDIDAHYPEFTHSVRKSGDLHLFAVTNSHDLYRYGTDILIEALAAAFTAKDEVVIHIKDYGTSAENKTLRDWVAAKPNFPRVVWHEDFLSKRALMDLYASMDVLLAPFRGEGYGMKILDAMALGIPVMMPAFGGPIDYAKDGTFIPLPYEEVPVGRCYDTDAIPVSKDAYWCEVDAEAFASILRSALQSRDNLDLVGRKARASVFGSLTWENAAKKLVRAVTVFQRQKDLVVSKRRHPSALPLSVIIPTHKRNDILYQTLRAYCDQDLPPDQFEIIIINDHGPREPLEALVADFTNKLSIVLVHNEGPGGPGNARNKGLALARGHIVFITGDDIVPARNLLTQHLSAHKDWPAREVAFVGYTPWHPSIKKDWLMDHIIGEGGHQFNYNEMRHRGRALFNRFYTSNVSLKRDFIISLEPIFSDRFYYAAFEDIELSYRLQLHGMELRYLETAIGFHYHPMTVDSFLVRQQRVGAMLTIMALVQPVLVPAEHYQLLNLLDARRLRDEPNPPTAREPFDSLTVTLKGELRRASDILENLSLQAGLCPLGTRSCETQSKQIERIRLETFDRLAKLNMRYGMAESWGHTEPERVDARNFLACISSLEQP